MLSIRRPDSGGGQPVPARFPNRLPVASARPLATARLLASRWLLLIAVLALACAVVAPSSISQASRGPVGVASASYQTGMGDESDEMFNDPLWRQLHIKYVRYIAPYDAAVRPYSLNKAKRWIDAAERQHAQVLVAFYHSEYTPTKLPSATTYYKDVQKFVKLFPKVRYYQSYDEANRGNVRGAFSSPSAAGAAAYYQALIRVCRGCTVIGLDVLDQFNITPTLRYIAEFKSAIGRLHTVMPRIWGLHNYSDVNRLESIRTKTLARALGSQIWLTETGGIVQFGGSFPNKNGSGLPRAAKVIQYMFRMASAIPQVKRLYIYDWSGGTTRTRFDAGLTDAKHKPRPGYVVVCRTLHAANCNVRVSNQ
jgi:hypothetical protein